MNSTRPRFGKPLSIKGSFLFLSDFEIPFHNAKFINDVFNIARLYNIYQCVWGGDAIHFESLSPFHGNDADVEAELSEIDIYLPAFLNAFAKIYWMMGNHDDRAKRAFDRKISNEKALRLILSPDNQSLFYERVTMSEYYWIRAAHGWQLEHQKNNSTIPTRVAQTLSAKFHKHVVTAHTHKVGAVRVNGKWAIDSGCGVDIKRLAYPNLRHSTHTEMENGAVLMLERGKSYVPLLLTPDRIDFETCQAKKQAA